MGKVENIAIPVLIVAVLVLTVRFFLITVNNGDEDGVSSPAAASDQDSPADETTSTTSPATPATTMPLSTLYWRTFDAGECVWWDQTDPFTRVETRDCSEPHLMEMTEPFELTGSGDEYPTEEEWDELTAPGGQCWEPAVDYLPVPLDPHGRFGPSLIRPLEDSWAGGLRQVWCGIGTYLRGDLSTLELGEFTGRVADQDQTFTYPPGTCLAAPFGIGVLVACADPHTWEVVGKVDLTGLYDSLPSDAQWEDIGSTICADEATNYAGAPLPSGYWPQVRQAAPESWDAGARRVNCLVSLVEDGSPVMVSGSIRDL